MALSMPKFLKRAEVRELLGISEDEMTKLVRAKAVKAVDWPKVPGKKSRARYLESDILNLVKKITKGTGS